MTGLKPETYTKKTNMYNMKKWYDATHQIQVVK